LGLGYHGFRAGSNALESYCKAYLERMAEKVTDVYEENKILEESQKKPEKDLYALNAEG